jgi:small subunit ribosomal protein S18
MIRFNTRQRIIRKHFCPFCTDKIEPDYRDIERLRRFLTERGKIVSGIRTGVCQKHQRRLARAIKQARFLALLPFTAGI